MIYAYLRRKKGVRRSGGIKTGGVCIMGRGREYL